MPSDGTITTAIKKILEQTTTKDANPVAHLFLQQMKCYTQLARRGRETNKQTCQWFKSEGTNNVKSPRFSKVEFLIEDKY